MKKKSFGKCLKTFFFAFGLLTFFGLPLLVLSNAIGIGSMISVVEIVKTQSLFHPSSSDIMDGIISGVAQSVDDPYTEYYNKAKWEEISSQLNNYEVSGIGIQLMIQKDGSLTVVSPIKGAPAERAGMHNNDVLKIIDGHSAQGMGVEEAASLLQGEAGTTVEVSLFRPSDGKEYSFTMKRKVISVPTVETAELAEYPELGHIRFSQFTEDSVHEMTEVLDELKDKQGLILDLRDNPGGHLYAALKIADLFLESGDIISTVDTRGKKTTYPAHGGDTALPLVVLVNGNSASSAEVLSAALHDNGRATLVGEKTFGKGIIQTLYPLRSGGVIKLTTQQYLTPKGISIHKVGIKPDYVVSDSAPGEEDQQLIKAIAILKQTRR